MELIGWDVESVGEDFVYVKKMPFLGWFAKIQRPEDKITQRQLQIFLKKRRYWAVQVEPPDQEKEKIFINLGFKKTRSPSLPTKTVRVRLNPPYEDLLKKMHNKTRYSIRHAEKLGVKVVLSNDINKFSGLWHKSSLRRGMFLSLRKEIKALFDSFFKERQIFFALYKDEIVGGIFLVSTKTTSYYMYAFSSQKGKKCFAPTLLVWESVKYAKALKKRYFDFEGIYDPRFPIKTWLGFTRFKKSFGGEEVEFPGPLRKLLFPFSML